jgi:hypothetical protein
MRSNPVLTVRRRTRRTAAALAGAILTLAACGSDGPDAVGDIDAGLETVRSGLEAADPGPVLAIFTDDVQLHSPALIGPEYRGRDLVASIVTPAMQVLGRARVTDVLRSDDGATGTVVFDAVIGTEVAQGVVLMRAEGERVSEITLLVRPMAALKAFVTRMAELGAKPALDAGP